MKLSLRDWAVFVVLSIVALFVWYKLSYPQISYIDLRISRNQAVDIAESFLRSRNIDPKSYMRAAVFNSDVEADRYFQKTLGPEAEEEFLRSHDYDLFSWAIRFFRENEKEEYLVRVSSRSGEIIAFRHSIEDTRKKERIEKTVALMQAQDFLRRFYNINFDDYDFHSEESKKYDNRIDYIFSWEKKGVYIPWRQIDNGGGAKMVISATVSGDEIKDFHKDRLDIPEKFTRYIEKQSILGGFLSSFFMLVFLGLIAWSVVIVIRDKASVVIRRTWQVFILLVVFIFAIRLLDIFNNLQGILYQYKTSSSFLSFIGVYFIGIIISYAFISLSVIMPGVAGESLRCEVYPYKKESSLFYFINSTFLSRSVSKSIIFGYLLFFVVLGLQSGLFFIGQRYLGVWLEKIRLTGLSSSYLPFLSAFIIGCSASLTEEIAFRLFAINWAKRYFKSSILAVVVASIIWGFSHTQYPIYPAWFRGLEVSVIGLFLGFAFLTYGIIPLFVAHYLFDVFWGVAAYVLGRSNSYLFYSSLFTLAIPLIFALIAYLVNREEKEKAIETVLSQSQRYNLEILSVYISEKKRQGVNPVDLRNELIANGWDRHLIELAFKMMHNENSL
jgi:hypothetical protein